MSAKVTGLFFGQLLDEQGRAIGSREGSVPSIFCQGDNDYLEFDIDVQTGRIVGWKRPDPVDLYKFRQREGHLRVPRNENTRWINIQGKCSDLFLATLYDAEDRVIGEYDGYALSCCHAGDDDYVEMDIDVDSGQIVGWKRPGAGELAQFKPARQAA